MDDRRGIADDSGIPWQGKIPKDVEYFREKTEGSTILMGYGTYLEFKKPLPGRRNIVATGKNQKLKNGFEPVAAARSFLQQFTEDVWVIGGAKLFESTIDLAEELYITQLDGDWHCTKFFPEFGDEFELKSVSPPQTENGITYTFQVWGRKNRASGL